MGFFDRDRNDQWRDDDRSGRGRQEMQDRDDDRWGRGRDAEGRSYEGRGYEGRGYEGRGPGEGRGYEGRFEGRGPGEGRGYEGRYEGRGPAEGRGPYAEGRGSEGRGYGEGRGFRGPEGRFEGRGMMESEGRFRQEGQRTMGQSWMGGREGTSMRGKGPKGYKRGDDRIKEDVSDVLMDHWAIDASEITVDVKDGIVTLVGVVTSRQEKRLAEDVLECLSGVKEVNNQLRVQRQDQGQQQQQTGGDGGRRTNLGASTTSMGSGAKI